MNCNTVQDLILLYVEGRCSSESAALVEEHVKICHRCNAFFNECTKKDGAWTGPRRPSDFRERINGWRASVLQSVLMLFSFALITLGVCLEAATPRGLFNGFWAFTLVIPAGGFLISLSNWNFIRFYGTGKRFSVGSCLITCGVTLSAFLWTMHHYELFSGKAMGLLSTLCFSDLAELFLGILSYFGPGLLASVCTVVASLLLSDRYARMLGKE